MTEMRLKAVRQVIANHLVQNLKDLWSNPEFRQAVVTACLEVAKEVDNFIFTDEDFENMKLGLGRIPQFENDIYWRIRKNAVDAVFQGRVKSESDN